MAKSSAGRSALSRTVDVLNPFDSSTVYLTASQIADVIGAPVSTVHRRLQEMCQLGLVERTGAGYRLGIRLWEWAARTPGATGLRSAALPHLQTLHGQVRQHAQIGVMQGTEVLFIERLYAPDAVVNFTTIGERLPALASSSGLAQLAHLPVAEQERVIAAGLRTLTPFTVTDPEAIRRRLAEIRRSGFVVNDGFIHPDARGIAVPLWGHRSDLLGAVSVIVPNDGRPSAPFVRILQQTAVRIGASFEAQSSGASGRPTTAG